MKTPRRPQTLPTQADFQAAISARSGSWYSACLRITHDPQLAEDAVQEGLLSAWQKRSQFKYGSMLETWIHSIAVNSALSLVRKRAINPHRDLSWEIEDSSDSLEELQHHAELDASLDRALKKLTDTERLCFVLRHLEEWKMNEIATALDKNVNAVKQAVFRGVHKLRQEMTMLAEEIR